MHIICNTFSRIGGITSSPGEGRRCRSDFDGHSLAVGALLFDYVSINGAKLKNGRKRIVGVGAGLRMGRVAICKQRVEFDIEDEEEEECWV